MADYPYHDEDPKRRRRRQRDYHEDAWGMAEYSDYGDGDFAAAEDYAAGMVDEEGRRENHYTPGYYHDEEVSEDGHTMPNESPINSDWRSEHIPGHSDGVERATDLLARMNAHTSYPSTAHPANSAQLPAQQGRYPLPEPASSPQQQPARNESDFSFTLIVALMIGALFFACVALSLYALLG